MKWKDLKFFQSEEFKALSGRLNYRAKYGVSILPPKEKVFRALKECPFDTTKVLILGQDPYPTKGHADGMAFSIDPFIAPKDFPKSLRNIFKELVDDIGCKYPMHGSLDFWAHQECCS